MKSNLHDINNQNGNELSGDSNTQEGNPFGKRTKKKQQLFETQQKLGMKDIQVEYFLYF